MGTAWVECWKCDVCGHRWIKTELWPSHCASSRCRSRRWNGGQVQPVKSEPVSVPESAVPVGEVISPRPSMADLRAIAAGNIAPVAVVDQVDSAPCPHVEWLEQEGESYACRLPAGHKGDCARGERIA